MIIQRVRTSVVPRQVEIRVVSQIHHGPLAATRSKRHKQRVVISDVITQVSEQVARVALLAVFREVAEGNFCAFD